MKNILKILPLAVLAAACAHAPGMKDRSPEPVSARGSAPIEAAGQAAAREKAIQDAQRSALIRAAGLFMDEDARAGSGPVLEIGLLKTPQLYVARRKIVSESRDGDSYRVEVRAWIHLDKLYSALRSMKLAGPGASAPEAALIVTGAGEAFTKSFREVFSRRSAIRLKELPPPPDPVPGQEIPDMTEYASSSGADLLFEVNVYSSAAGSVPDGTDFVASRAEASLAVYNLKTGEEALSLSTQANAIDSTQAASFAKSLASAGEMLAQEAATRSSRLSSAGGTPLRIRIFGLSGLESVEKLRDQLQGADLEGLRAESYADGVAVFTAVPLRSDPHELASAVIRTDSFGLELEGVGPGEISFSLPR